MVSDFSTSSSCPLVRSIDTVCAPRDAAEVLEVADAALVEDDAADRQARAGGARARPAAPGAGGGAAGGVGAAWPAVWPCIGAVASTTIAATPATGGVSWSYDTRDGTSP